jgi:glycolate oxidase iron-sulfur subunit
MSEILVGIENANSHGHSGERKIGASSFDEHHAPENELLRECVHCGFCLSACPTYALWHDEMDSPRGRIYMMKAASEGAMELTGNFQMHMDNCLGCMACMTACPSGVDYSKLIEATRAQMERNIPRPLMDRIYRRLLFAIFPYPKRLKWMVMPLRIYEKSGLQALVRQSGLLRLLPERLRNMEALLPEASAKSAALPKKIAAVGTTRMRVAMMTGCVQQVFFPGVNAATARILAAEGCEVVIPQEQGCCGALMVHNGVEEAALEFARRMIAQFEEELVDRIVINSAGCGSTLKEYGHMLRDDVEWAERAAKFAAKCRDITEMLTELEPRAKRHPLAMKIAYHDACHLQHAQGIRKQPRMLLMGIPELKLEEIADAVMCCGSAGVYNLLHAETANELGRMKVENLLATGAEAVVSANPGCLMQLASGLRERKVKMPSFHTVEILDAAIRGVSVKELLDSKS